MKKKTKEGGESVDSFFSVRDAYQKLNINFLNFFLFKIKTRTCCYGIDACKCEADAMSMNDEILHFLTFNSS